MENYIRVNSLVTTQECRFAFARDDGILVRDVTDILGNHRLWKSVSGAEKVNGGFPDLLTRNPILQNLPDNIPVVWELLDEQGF